MAKQRVLQVVPSFAMGGAERMAVHLATNLDPSRFDVAALSMYDPQGTDLEDMLARHGHRVWYLSKKRGVSPRMFLRIDRVVREFRWRGVVFLLIVDKFICRSISHGFVILYKTTN